MQTNTKTENQPISEVLQEKREALTSRFISGEAPDFPQKHARFLDDYFRESFAISRIGPHMGLSKNPYAIIALGGYGRQEQCIHSDVDLLFLFGKYVPTKAEELIREVVYPLWDIGLDVGYATRSMKECVGMALEDLEVLTPILDARFICGMSPLYSDLMEKLRNKIGRRKTKSIIKQLIEYNRDRHHYFGDSAYLIEPNLKEGQGGLRDYHTMLWIAQIKTNLKEVRDLIYHSYLSHKEYDYLIDSLQFIMNVRNRLHHLTGRRCDRLHFEYQVQLAAALGFEPENGQQPVERFLGELHGHMEFIKQQHQMFLYELGYTPKLKRRKKVVKSSSVSALEVTDDGMLNFVSPEKIIDTPDLLIRVFEESVRLQIPLSIEAKRLVKEFSYLVDHVFWSAAENIKSFERILTASPPTFNVLDEMLNTGILVKFIPEYKNIENRIQYNRYHLYPVDRHSLRTIQTLKTFGTAEGAAQDSLGADLYKELKNRRLLFWAALFHDIGKGTPGESHSISGAKIVRKALTNRGFKEKDVATVTFLVLEHLRLVKTATRRDLHDEQTAIHCARIIGDIKLLKLLYLLTVADSMATGPLAWNDWTATLLKDLFFKVFNILEKGELATHQAMEVVASKKTKVLESTSDPEARQNLETLYNFMSPRYLLYMPANHILEHIHLYNKLGAAEFIWKVTPTPDSNTRTVTVCAQDRPGLFSKISGIFTLNNLNILGAQAFTWRNNIALDIFEVTPPPDQLFETERWSRAEGHLQDALAGRLDLAQALKEKMTAYRTSDRSTSQRPHRVVVDNESSSFFTIVEVFAYDFPGLLYSITDALFRCRLDVWVSKIATNVDQVVDVFYVRDFDGQKIDIPEQVAAVKDAIEDVLPGVGDEKAHLK
ncbi:MAG: [protein-PII] uridylyltransferase [Desulfobacterales bacterium]|uniref:Bifunctional uridylyltransferase/uridylyl-removing enzyme n=1 Tax=Candidatus Desulfatibia vada TaxID=2841696 RepID=A0A8J6TQ52_9BACT|nr:[protein-PII] uridylyltransferase [Candidatus Desulfatibia vada]